MPKTVFFSWQSDRPPKEGRNFLERALTKAISALADEPTLIEAARELELDRDIKGVPGSPAITDTIFRKIDDATVFVADLTFVGLRVDGRPMPNPNVLIEYGRAQRSVGPERIIAVMNTAYGAPDEANLPFNLRHVIHPISYTLVPDASEEARKTEKDRLSKVLRGAILACMASVPEPVPQPPKPYVSYQTGWKPGFFRAEGAPIGLSDNMIGPPKEVRFEDGSPVWLRLMPQVDPGRKWSLTELRKAALTVNDPILPHLTGGGGLNYVRGEDGLGTYVPFPSEESTKSVVYCFRSGEVWSFDTYSLAAWADQPGSPIPWMKGEFDQALPRYGRLLMDLGIEPPFRWEVGMSGIKGRHLGVPGRSPIKRNACVTDIVQEQGLYSPGESVIEALKPFYDKLYESCGIDIG